MKKLLILLAFICVLNADIINQNITTWDFNNKNYAVIDVRTPAEIATFGSINATYLITIIKSNNSINEKFVDEVKKHFKENDGIALVCQTGNRSLMAARILGKAGFTNLVNLSGGVEALKKSRK